MPCRIAVAGRSMAPTLSHGDHVLVLPGRRGLRRGDLVVLRDPTSPQRWIIKRLVALPGEHVIAEGRTLSAGDGVLVLGDNPEHSTDSRSYGAVPLRAVSGRAWYRYAPADRTGRLARGTSPRPG